MRPFRILLLSILLALVVGGCGRHSTARQAQQLASKMGCTHSKLYHTVDKAKDVDMAVLDCDFNYSPVRIVALKRAGLAPVEAEVAHRVYPSAFIVVGPTWTVENILTESDAEMVQSRIGGAIEAPPPIPTPTPTPEPSEPPVRPSVWTQILKFSSGRSDVTSPAFDVPSDVEWRVCWTFTYPRQNSNYLSVDIVDDTVSETIVEEDRRGGKGCNTATQAPPGDRYKLDISVSGSFAHTTGVSYTLIVQYR